MPGRVVGEASRGAGGWQQPHGNRGNGAEFGWLSADTASYRPRKLYCPPYFDPPYPSNNMDHLTMQHPPPCVSLPVNLVANLQDSLLMAVTDLQRLEGLLDHATANLMERFGTANQALGALEENRQGELGPIRNSLHQAVTELQFHDMATQLIVHTGKVLQSCAWRLAEEAMEPEEGEVPLGLDPMPERPSPVTQSEMDAGSIDLF